jgi:hypothetical protein
MAFAVVVPVPYVLDDLRGYRQVRPEWILPLWIAITAVILSLAGVARRKANRERGVAPIR